MAREGQILLDGHPYDILSQGGDRPSGKRSYQKSRRPSQGTDSGFMQEAVWTLGGQPIGNSREGANGALGHDYSDNLDTYYSGLLTSAAKANDITLEETDIGGTTTPAFYGSAIYGDVVYQGGTSSSMSANVSHIGEQISQYLLFARGSYLTLVDTALSVVSTDILDAPIRGLENWQGFNWLGQGEGVELQKVYGYSTSGIKHSSVSNTYVGEMRVGNDRLWYVVADTNKAGYTLDDFSNQATPFAVGDTKRRLNGIGTLGPFTIFGALNGVYGFTDAGKPVRVVDALRGSLSPNNGLKHASLWGWNYFVADIGLYAWTPNVANPVGVEALHGFEGAIDGRPTAILAWRESLFVAYLTTAGHAYIIRGEYNANTDGTGQPDWYPFAKFTSAECDALFATSTMVTNPTLLAGKGTNAVYFTMGKRGRDIADSNYRFSSAGGAWYGTTLMRSQHLMKYPRMAMFKSENCSAAGYWQLAVELDDSGDYLDFGARVDTNGVQFLRPAEGDLPRGDMAFHTLKPRLTQVSGASDASTVPPQIRGNLTIVYTERPEWITDVQCTLVLKNHDLERLERLNDGYAESSPGQYTSTPIRVSLPGETMQYFGFVESVSPTTDVRSDGVQTVQVNLSLWDTGGHQPPLPSYNAPIVSLD